MLNTNFILFNSDHVAEVLPAYSPVLELCVVRRVRSIGPILSDDLSMLHDESGALCPCAETRRLKPLGLYGDGAPKAGVQGQR